MKSLSIKHWTISFIVLLFSFCNGFAQTPKAELLTPSQDICEKSDIPIIIKFTGTAPFNAKVEIWNQTDQGEVKIQVYNIVNLYPIANYISNHTFDPLIFYPNPRINQIKIKITNVSDASGSPVVDGTGEAIITSYQMPTPNLATNASTCGISLPIAALPGPHGNIYDWTIISGSTTGSFDPTNQPSTNFSGPAGNYLLSFKVTNGPCVASKQINATLNGSPSGTISTTSEICSTGNAELKFDLTGNGPWNLKYSDGTSQFPITGINSPSTNLTHQAINGETTFKLIELSDVNGCDAETGTISGEATVIDLKPIVFAGLDDEICGDSFTMEANESAYPGTWIGPEGAIFSSINSPSTAVSVFNYGPQTFSWVLNNKGCTSDDDVTITFWEQPSTPFAGDDTTLYMKFQTTMNAALPNGFTGNWSLLNGVGTIKEIDNPSTNITDLKIGSSTFQWTVSNGICEPVNDNITINIKGLNHYTGFSPDGNNINEKFEITGAPFIENNELIVFNQVGQVVYKKDGYENDWTGTNMDGQPLPNGYYYFIFSGSGIDPIKDFLVIKRLNN